MAASAKLGAVGMMLPPSRRERAWFALLALTAGMGEELVWRGFGGAALVALQLDRPLWLLSLALPFGEAHFYQVPHGMRATALLGALLSILYRAMESLLPPMILLC